MRGKIYKKRANNSKSYLSDLNNLVDEYNKTYHNSIGKRPINAYCFDLTENIESNPKAPMFKLDDRVRITTYTEN